MLIPSVVPADYS